jgi:hypothetical protein
MGPCPGQGAPGGHLGIGGVDAAELDGETDKPVADGSDAEDHHVHHHGVGDVFVAGEARLHEGEARLHEEHEETREEHPEDIDGFRKALDALGRLIDSLHRRLGGREADDGEGHKDDDEEYGDGTPF